ncbi:MAG: hypothetical protein AAF720_12095 [Pseudomonadota bacterium]
MPSLVAHPIVEDPVYPIVDETFAYWMSKGGDTLKLRKAVEGSCGFVLPGPGACIALSEKEQAVWAAPDQWFVMGVNPPASLASHIHFAEQSDGRVVFSLPDLEGRDLLAAGCSVDLHPEAFLPGMAATSKINHFTALFWQPTLEPKRINVAVFRSYAQSFNSWLGDRRRSQQQI